MFAADPTVRAVAAAQELRIAAAARRRLRADCGERWPHEACGLLLGEASGPSRRVTAVAPATNVHADPRRAFAIDPLQALRLAGEGGDVLGIYHSHPEGAAQPSEEDREAAAAIWPRRRTSWSYVIVATQRGVVQDVRSFVLRDGAFAAEPLVFEELAGRSEVPR